MDTTDTTDTMILLVVVLLLLLLLGNGRAATPAPYAHGRAATPARRQAFSPIPALESALGGREEN